MTRIFVDTNILFDDPFLQGNNKYLLDLASRKNIELIFSQIVIKETSEILKARLKDIIHEYKVNQSKLRKLTRTPLTSSFIERKAIVDDFESFFDDLKSKEKIKIIPPNTEVLELALKDLLDKKAPFFNGKNELKDCVIWYSYANYSNGDEDERCILLTNNIRDFGDRNGDIHQRLSSSSDNFKLVRSIADLKLELGEVPLLTESQKSSNTLAEIKMKDLFQKDQTEVLIEHLNEDVNEYYKFRAFNKIIDSKRKFIQVSDIDILSISTQRGNDNENLQDFSGTITAELKLEIYETNTRRIINGSRINLVEVQTTPFLFDFEVILNSKNHIEYLDISNLTEIRETISGPSIWDYPEGDDLPF